jgi:NAD(P)-dependent dehydrogenase (short-subunit alcohol dehydrogenase family)
MAVQDVVVTGTSSGIGLALARQLCGRGVRVFGSVRGEADAARVRADLGETFVPLAMDVTDSDAIARSVEVVGDALGGRTLDGLVNNAAVGLFGPLLEQPIEEVEEQLRVNVIGALRVIQAFAPLLGASKARSGSPGRIVNISSTSGKIGLPFLGGYTASKQALEGLSESLRRELMLYGIDVVVVGPGAVVTPAWDRVESRATAYASGVYGPIYEAFVRFLVAEGKKGLPPERIAEAVWEALTAPKPRVRYAVVPKSFLNWTLPRVMPARAMDRGIARRFGIERGKVAAAKP